MDTFDELSLDELRICAGLHIHPTDYLAQRARARAGTDRLSQEEQQKAILQGLLRTAVSAAERAALEKLLQQGEQK